MTKQRAAALAPGDADIRVLRFARPVHHAAHHGDFQRRAQMRRLRAHARHDARHVDAGAAAGGAGNDVHRVAPQAHRAQNAQPRFHLRHGIAGERHADGVANAVQQQAADADGGFDVARARLARLGHADVQRIRASLAQ